MENTFLVLDKDYVEEHLDTVSCIDLMQDTLIKEHKKQFTQYLRTSHVMPNKNIIAFMPAYSEDGYFGAKILSVFPQNGSQGFPSHQGQILLFEAEHGVLKASIDATTVTKIRTGAVSGAATRALARKDSKVLAILGSGEQAESHLKAIAPLFGLEEIRIWSRRTERAEEFCKEYAEFAKPAKMVVCSSADEAVKDADIICTLTASKEPLFKAESVKPGAHINAVGACTAAARELDTETVKMSRFFCDSTDSVFAEAGDFVIPMKEGAITKDHLLGTLGQLFCGEIQGRISDTDVTVFESLGIACEDMASANFLVKNYK